MKQTKNVFPVPSIAPSLRIDSAARDPRVARLKSADECRVFITNAIERGRPDLARQALDLAFRFNEDFGRRLEDRRIVSTLCGHETSAASVAAPPSGSTVVRTWKKVNRGGFLRRVERTASRPGAHRSAAASHLRRTYVLLEGSGAGIAAQGANDPAAPPWRLDAPVAA